ncbi:MAG: hypothetical protein KAK00_08280 [Nanoarchaeota archaeon]|nr:hypothetical protein [Nanoarchaeota archaeon]
MNSIEETTNKLHDELISRKRMADIIWLNKENMDIDYHIDTLKIMADISRNYEKEYDKLSDSDNVYAYITDPEYVSSEDREYIIGMYKYLKGLGAKTKGQARDLIRRGEIKPVIIREWIDEMKVLTPEAIKVFEEGYHGYREIRELLQSKK